MMIDINGRAEKKIKESIKQIVPGCLKILNINSANLILEIDFATLEKIKKLNKSFRNIDKATDVLSFPQASFPAHNTHLGTIVICAKYAELNNTPLLELIKHGLLHLLGYDHETNHSEWAERANLINHTMGAE